MHRPTLTVPVVLAIALGWAVPALALTVAIVRPHACPALTNQTIVRLSLELASIGVGTEMVDASAGAGEKESSAWLAAVAEQNRVDAVVVILGDTGPDAVEVWAIDRATGRSVSRRLPFDVDANAERAPETLAVRAMELLRSTLLEMDLTASPPGPQSAVVAPALSGAPAQPKHRPERLAIDVGIAAVTGPGGVGASVLPVVHVGWSLGPALGVRGALAALGTRASVERSVGDAQVSQEFVALGAAYRFRADRQLRPLVTLSAGALRTSVDGSARSPNQGHTTNQWSFLIEAGLGAALRLDDRFFVAAEVDLQLAEPYVAIRFLESVVATRARPIILPTLSIGAWL